MTVEISCTCRLRVEVDVNTLRDAEMIADQHERENMRRAYRHDASAMEITR